MEKTLCYKWCLDVTNVYDLDVGAAGVLDVIPSFDIGTNWSIVL
jgi:hypothetical protein